MSSRKRRIAAKRRPSESGASQTPFPLVGVGASAGGMEAFVAFLQELPLDSGLAFVLVQHLDPTHPSRLSEALQRVTALPVEEIRDGTRVSPNHVYVMPSDADVSVVNGVLRLFPRSLDVRHPHLPIDFFFRSLALDKGPQAFGVVLSGTGADGAEGLRAVKAEGGVCFAQAPNTAKFSGMPDAAISTGVVDFALPIQGLVAALLQAAKHPFVHGAEGGAFLAAADEAELGEVFALLRSQVGIDFRAYKRASVKRRLTRRIVLHRLGSLAEYVARLRNDPVEVQGLRDDLLIQVTSFFRDPDVFDALKRHVFPKILEQRREGGVIRIWTAGCATGEEAYSVVICLLEFLAEEKTWEVPIQLFGTDVSGLAIEKARAGWYSDAIVREIEPTRLARYFTKVEGGGYRISKTVRDRCAFVKHDLTADPPFSKLDLVTCRNVLIYFDQELQRRVMSTLQFALRDPGFLLLGHAENIVDGNAMFSVVSKQDKIFQAVPNRTALKLGPARGAVKDAAIVVERRGRTATIADAVKRMESLLLDRYAPAGVIVNARMEIVHFQGRTGPYLEPTPGQPQHDLLKMARKGLVADLRIAIAQAGRESAQVRRVGALLGAGGATEQCEIVVIPLLSPESTEGLFGVLFGALDSPVKTEPVPYGPTFAGNPEARLYVEKLEDELRTTKDYLHTIIDEHERTNEELLAANEELVSSNEELQSLNEEMETAKEELQSTNEELSTLNEELHARNNELDSANSDLVNILGSVEIPLVIVDSMRRIRRCTPRARPILNLLPTDIGRPIDDIKPNLSVENFDRKIQAVIASVTMQEEEVQGRDGRWCRLQIRPYLTVDKKVDGAVISVIDIDTLKRALDAAEWARDYARAAVEAVQIPLLILDERLKILSANRAFYRAYAAQPFVAGLEHVYAAMAGVWDIPELREALGRALSDDAGFYKLEVEHDFKTLGLRFISMSGRAVLMPNAEQIILLSLEDTTERRRGESERARLLQEANAAKASAEEANRTKDLFLATLSHELRTPLSTLLLTSQMLMRTNLDDAKVKKAGLAIERATRAQSRLIDDLLDITRIMAGKLVMDQSRISLVSVVRQVAATFSEAIAKKRLELVLQLDVAVNPILADRLRLQQVVSNLLTNAIKFTPSGGSVTLIVDQVERSARLRVVDTGSGIESSFLPDVFTRFSQENTLQTRVHGGLGLGLAIVQSLVEAQGGSVLAESPGKGLGATFTVLFPIADESVPPVRAPSERPARLQNEPNIEGIRILVVEDDEGTREALQEMLEMKGAEVLAVESASAAMASFEAFSPRLLICDIAMPDEDGYKLIQRIRALGPERGGGLPALALTAHATGDDRRRVLAAGFQLHVAKPVDADRLVAALSSLLSLPYAQGSEEGVLGGP